MTIERLDSDELLHLALREANEERHDQAITYLKRALDLSPDDARVHYMLGAEHAQIGLYERAVSEMRRAVELDPNLSTASFQLGLLHLTAGRVDQAEQAWAALDRLDSDNALRLFKTGLIHLTRDEFQPCAELLKRGMTVNTLNVALNQDMQRILGEVEKRLGQSIAEQSTSPREPQSVSRGPGHVLLSAYRRNRTQEDE